MAGGAARSQGRGSDVLELFEGRGGACYLGEPVTLLGHALQCAALASDAGDPPDLVAACLLHDVGWLLPTAGTGTGTGTGTEAGAGRGAGALLQPGDPADDPGRGARHGAEQPGHDHAERGASFLARWYTEGVREPVRLHVMAKRFLVTVEPGALEDLSAESRRTLALQGGPLSPEEAAAFERLHHGVAARRLRRHDDDAKVPGRRCAPLEAYVDLLDELAR